MIDFPNPIFFLISLQLYNFFDLIYLHRQCNFHYTVSQIQS